MSTKVNKPTLLFGTEADLDFWTRCQQNNTSTGEPQPKYRSKDYPWSNYFEAFVGAACRPGEGIGYPEGACVMCSSHEAADLAAANFERNLKTYGILYEAPIGEKPEVCHFQIEVYKYEDGAATVRLNASFQHRKLDETFRLRMVDFVNGEAKPVTHGSPTAINGHKAEHTTVNGHHASRAAPQLV